ANTKLSKKRQLFDISVESIWLTCTCFQPRYNASMEFYLDALVPSIVVTRHNNIFRDVQPNKWSKKTEHVAKY
ncbi:unnamed protein product, partial [Callosobruchus maculatus]